MSVHWLSQSIRYGSLTLPTAANPLITTGGLWGESKQQLWDSASPQARARLATTVSMTRWGDAIVDLDRAVTAMKQVGLGFPVVAKPDVGCRGAGVEFIATADQLKRYIQAFPNGKALLIQRYVPYEGEAGIYYVRHPAEACGKIESLTLKYRPYVIGDGSSTLRKLIERDTRAARLAPTYLARLGGKCDVVVDKGVRVCLTFAGNHARGAIFRNGDRYIGPGLREAIDAIVRGIPEFHVGRFDVRFSTIAELSRGEGFSILELNGIGAEPTNIWDPDATVREVVDALRRHVARLFQIGDANRRRGFEPAGLLELTCGVARERWLARHYPVLAD